MDDLVLFRTFLIAFLRAILLIIYYDRSMFDLLYLGVHFYLSHFYFCCICDGYNVFDVTIDEMSIFHPVFMDIVISVRYFGTTVETAIIADYKNVRVVIRM